MKHTTAVVTALLLAGLASGTRAQDEQAEALPVYDVEMVVFRHLRPLLSSEQWSARTMAANLDGALDLAQPEVLPDQVETIIASEPQRLLEHAAKINGMSNFEVLAQRAWRQPGFENEAAVAIRLNAGPLDEPMIEQQSAVWNLSLGDYVGEPPVDDASEFSPQTPPPEPAAEHQSNVEQPVASPGVQQPEAEEVLVTDDDLAAASTLITHTLDGTVTLVRSRFLHVYTDLIYTIPSDVVPHAIRHRPLGNPVQAMMEVGSGSFGAAAEPLPMQSFPLRYHRRMRSNELHYIDHPLLGILILVTRVEADASKLTE